MSIKRFPRWVIADLIRLPDFLGCDSCRSALESRLTSYTTLQTSSSGRASAGPRFAPSQFDPGTS
jgi:hypothetical protein